MGFAGSRSRLSWDRTQTFLDGSQFPRIIVFDALGKSFRDFNGWVSAVAAIGLRVGMGEAG